MSLAIAAALQAALPRWPWPSLAAGWRHLMQAFCDALRGHEAAGWEASCRFGPDGIHSGLRAAALHDDLGALAARWRLDAGAAAACLAAIAQRELGRLAAGTDHRDRGFLTVYATARSPDFRHAMQAQAVPAASTASPTDCAS